MNKISLLFFSSILLMFVSIVIYSCKKNKNEASCGCNSADVKYNLLKINGTLSFFQNKGRWVLRNQPLPGNSCYYFPCNLNQDSLKAITRAANHNEVFQVRFSGKVKSTCPDETFGYTNGVTTFDYIILDSLKRY